MGRRGQVTLQVHQRRLAVELGQHLLVGPTGDEVPDRVVVLDVVEQHPLRPVPEGVPSGDRPGVDRPAPLVELGVAGGDGFAGRRT